jgi:hypothetical protein
MESLNTYKAITEEGRIKKYFSSKAVNNSLLKKVENPAWIRYWEENTQLETEDIRHFRIGRAVDCLLTDKENFSSQFFVFNVNRPTGLMLKFIDNLPLFELNEEVWDEDEFKANINIGLYLRAYAYSGYKKNINAIIKDFWTKGELCGYYRAREQAQGKDILSNDDFEEIDVAVRALEQLPDIRSYFGVDKNDETREVLYQVPIYHTVTYPEDISDPNIDLMGKAKDGVMQFKGLLDLVIVNHFDRTIEPIDLKTTSSNPQDFEDAFYKYGYFRQAAFYVWLIQNADGYFQDLFREGYTLMPFKFIVAPKKEFFGQSALKFVVSEKTLDIGLNGGYGKINGTHRHFRGIFEYIEAYRWHRKFDIFNISKWIFDSNYTLEL